MMLLVLMLMVQFAEGEIIHRSSSDESSPEEVDSKLLRKQLLEVSVHVYTGEFFICKFRFPLGLNGSWLFVVLNF